MTTRTLTELTIPDLTEEQHRALDAAMQSSDEADLTTSPVWGRESCRRVADDGDR